MNRPLLWAAASFAAGAWMAGRQDAPFLWIISAVVVLLLIYLGSKKLPYRDGLPIALVFLVLGAALESAGRPARLGDALAIHVRQNPEMVYRLEGRVQHAPIFVPGMEYASVRMKAEHVSAGGHDTELTGGVVIRWSSPAFPLHPGDRIRIEGQMEPVLGEVNMGVRGVEDFYRTHGYHSVLRTRGDRPALLGSPTLDPRYWASRLRQWQAGVFAQAAPKEIRSFLRAVWLGDRAGLPDEEYEPYLRTGTAHILAVSGVHVGIVYMALQWMLRSFVRSRKRRAGVVMVAVVVFALVTGARPPILRAAFMVCLYLWAELLEREPDAPTALSIAALAFLLYNPGLIRDTGFALSFTSLASILLFSELLNERLTLLPQGIRQNIAAATGVSILPLPLGAHVFHVIPIVGPFCNLLVIPLLSLILWLCMLTVVTATISTDIASLFGHAAAPLVKLIALVTNYAAGFRWASVTVTSPTLPAWLAYGAGALCMAQWLYRRPHPRRWLAASAILLVLAGGLWRPLSTPASIDFLDVAHGDATFVRTPGGTTLLIDAGDRSEYVDMGRRVVVPWLLSNGIEHLDYIVVTHADRDHIGGVTSVMDQIAVGEVLLWPEFTNDPLELELLEQCAAHGVSVRRVAGGETIAASGAKVSVLHPPATASRPGSNDNSIVLRVTWPGMDALLTGDIEREAENELREQLQPTTLLKVPHHGSHTSSSAPFLDATQPDIAVVSTRRSANRQAVGRDVLPRYEERGIAIYRTDYHGGVRVRVRGDQIEVHTARGIRGYSLDPGDQP